MADVDLEAIRERHLGISISLGTGLPRSAACRCDLQAWPCDTRLLLERIAALEKVVEAARSLLATLPGAARTGGYLLLRWEPGAALQTAVDALDAEP